MSRAGALRGLAARLARQALAQGSEAGTSNGNSVRHAHTEISAKYSPKPFQKQAPLDRSAAWIPHSPYIEAWMHRRNTLEREFSWNTRNTIEVGYFLIGFTVALYGFSVWTIRHSDARNHYPQRDMLLASSPSGFRLPDEREWY